MPRLLTMLYLFKTFESRAVFEEANTLCSTGVHPGQVVLTCVGVGCVTFVSSWNKKELLFSSMITAHKAPCLYTV